MWLKVLKQGEPQYTSRWKKTLMVLCECTNCGKIKLFRKARVDSWQTKSCWCLKLKEVKPWSKYYDLTILIEWPRMQNIKRKRQLYVLCKCWNKFLLPLAQWWIAKRCKNCNKNKKK